MKLYTCYGARRVVIRKVCGLAGLTLLDSPGLGLAYSEARETDRGLSFFGSMGFFFYPQMRGDQCGRRFSYELIIRI
jgi:hypothetical protein